MSTNVYVVDEARDEKQLYDANVQDVVGDNASSIDTITALVNEGMFSLLHLFSPEAGLIEDRSWTRNPATHHVMAESRLAPLW